MKELILIVALLQSVEDVYKSATADFEAGKWADAAAKYEQVLKEAPDLLQSRFNLAASYSKIGKIDEAIASYQKLLEQNGTIYEAHVNLALLLDEAGKSPEAGEEFEKALALRPDDAQLELNVATFYLRTKQDDKAYPHLLRLVEKGPASVDLYLALSDIERARKNEAKSREYLEKILQLDGNRNSLKIAS